MAICGNVCQLPELSSSISTSPDSVSAKLNPVLNPNVLLTSHPGYRSAPLHWPPQLTPKWLNKTHQHRTPRTQPSDHIAPVLIQFHFAGNFAFETQGGPPTKQQRKEKTPLLIEWNLKQDQVGECNPSNSS